jgi:catechol 2,3-dioxygenase-like lactoylglutathione lyase family enzyme
MPAWREVLVSVADMAAARSLWVDQFGFEITFDKEGPDERLADIFRLHPEEIVAQLGLRSPGAEHGMLHLVQFYKPGPPVRQDAASTDRCPKNLDVYVDDLPRRLETLRAAGYPFPQGDYSEVSAPNGTRFREIHMTGHDGLNIVLIQLMKEGATEGLTFSEKGFAGIGALVTVVEECEADYRFYRDTMHLDLLAEHTLAGPEIERMIGLPAGASLDIRILGETGQHLGQIEVIEYRGARGKDLYPRTTPPATGILAAGFGSGEDFTRHLSPGGFKLWLESEPAADDGD